MDSISKLEVGEIMKHFSIEATFLNEDIHQRIKKLKLDEDWGSIDYGYITLKMNDKVIHNPFCDHKNKTFCGKFTDGDWLFRLYSQLLDLLEAGFNKKGTSIPFFDNPLELYFQEIEQDRIKVYFCYRMLNGFEKERVIQSVESTQKEIAETIINSFESIYLLFITSNPIAEKKLYRYKESIDVCKKKYTVS